MARWEVFFRGKGRGALFQSDESSPPASCHGSDMMLSRVATGVRASPCGRSLDSFAELTEGGVPQVFVTEAKHKRHAPSAPLASVLNSGGGCHA
jgi:hypothetical protein